MAHRWRPLCLVMLATIGIVASGTGFRPAGILISTYCESTTGTDASGATVSGSWMAVGTYTDGVGGFYDSQIGENTLGCYHPAGYYYSYNETPSVIFWQNSGSGETGYYTWFAAYSWTFANGIGGSSDGGTGVQFGYYGTIINEYLNVSEGLKYIVAFDPNGGGSGNAGYYEYTVTASGVLLSSQCVSQYDPNTGYYTGDWYYQETYSDGSGGTYSTIIGENTNGCWHPSGYQYSSSQSDVSISWSHGTDSGDFVYGYYYESSYADGNGGIVSGSGINVTATDGQVVHAYDETDFQTGFTINNTLYFRASDNTLQTSSYIAYGTLLRTTCQQRTENDAGGFSWTINVEEYAYANGSGGEYIQFSRDTSNCGYLPSGYYKSYSPYTFSLYYTDEFGNTQTFNYGETYYYIMADGNGGEFSGSGDVTYYYGMGYNFYSYYDSAGNQTVTYYWDGSNSYYIGYS